MPLAMSEWRKHVHRFLADYSELREAEFHLQTHQEAEAIEEWFGHLGELAARLRQLDEEVSGLDGNLWESAPNDDDVRESQCQSMAPERELIAELTVAMGVRLSNIGWRDAVNQDITYLEKAAEVLAGIGTLECERDLCRFKFLVHSQDVVRHIVANNMSIDVLSALTAFIGVGCEEGDIPCGRVSFVCSRAYFSAMNALVSAGYARRIGNRFAWTTLVMPIMKTWEYWDHNLISWQEMDELDLEAQALLALYTMPDRIADEFFSPPAKSINFLIVLACCWRDGQWQHPIDGASLTRDSFSLAHRMVQITQDRMRGERDTLVS